MTSTLQLPSSDHSNVTTHVQSAQLPARLQPHLAASERPESSRSANPSVASSNRSRYHNALNIQAAEALRKLRIGETPSLGSESNYWEDTQSQAGDSQAMRLLPSPHNEEEVQEVHMRHGFTAQLSAEQLRELNTNFYMYYGEKRHETGGVPKERVKEKTVQDWRMKDRLKTISAILPLCLNIGVDPPGTYKTHPQARLECWTEPAGPVPGQNHMATIVKQLQTQYEQLSMRTRYKVLPDPTADEIKKFTTTIRRNARDERVLFHYNGHGVPEPTTGGEMWFFNKNYTQYIPVSMGELQNWLGTPSILVYDCNNAGRLLKNFDIAAEKHIEAAEEQRKQDPGVQIPNFGECIQLAACNEDERLPTNPFLPGDLFTSCLTTPIEMAVRFYVLQTPLRKDISLDDASKIPGRSQERRTPLGELNWIFTAITDTIAWNTLPRPLFKRLFRQDLMVAALFRNFLLAQRVMRAHRCQPLSYPEIPPTHDHPLWASWDLAVEGVLSQLPALQDADEKEIEQVYNHSDFFKDQLTAFEVYLDHGAREEKEPEQLPIVLQVLLSQVHRLRALVLLSRFLDLGPWAVKLALGIGIFPYVLKLLQSQAQDLKAPLVFIWARVLAVDQSCQQDLIKDNGYQYFSSILNPATGLPVSSVSDHRAMGAFIIAMFCRNFKPGQQASHSAELVQACLSYISFEVVDNPVLRQWACLCLSTMWKDYVESKWTAIKHNGHISMCELVTDPVPEVRASMLYAMSTFVGTTDLTPEIMAVEEEVAMRLLTASKDSCVIVRKELTVFFSAWTHRYMNRIIVAAVEQLYEEIYEQLRQIQQEVEEEESSDQGSVGNGNLRGSKSEVVLAGSASSNGTRTEMNDSPSNSFKHGTARSMSGTTFGGDSFAYDDHLDLNNGQLVRRLPKQTLSGETPYMAVWLHILVLALDADIQVSRNAATIVHAVILAVLAEPALSHFAEDMIDVYSEFTADLELPDFSKSAAIPKPQTPAPATPAASDAQKGDGYLSIGMRRTASVAATLANLAFGLPSSADTPASPPKSVAKTNGLTRQATVTKSFGDLTKVSEESQIVANYRRVKFPYPAWWKNDQAKMTSTIPIKSDFFDYALEYYKEHQMKHVEEDEPGSKIYNERLWRRNRNEKILEQTQNQKELAGSSRWDQQSGYFNNSFQPSVMTFHQYENHIVIADDYDTIRVWDWERQKPLNRFSNGNAIGSRINEMRLINEDDEALLMTASSDGSIKIFQDYELRQTTSLLTAFNSMTRPDAHSSEFSLSMDWLQTRGEILTAGDSKSIRVWSAHTELLSNEIRTLSSTRVTSITSDQVQGNLICAGFEDGTVRVYDQREHRLKATVRSWREHNSPILNLHMQRGGIRELVSCSQNGTVKLWDALSDSSIHTVRATQQTAVSFSVHEHAPVFAVGTSKHKIRVFNTDGETLSTFEPLETVRPQQKRTIPIAAVAFHPHRMMLAASSRDDNFVSLYTCKGLS